MIAGCGDAEAPEPPRPVDPPPAEEGLARAALAEVPQSISRSGIPVIAAADLDRASRASDVDRPGVDAGGTALAAWQTALQPPRVAVPLPGIFLRAAPSLRHSIGFDLRDAVRFVALEGPGDRWTVLHTRPGTAFAPSLPTEGDIVASQAGTIGERTDAEASARVFPFVAAMRRRGNRIAIAPSRFAIDSWNVGASLLDVRSLADLTGPLDDHDGYAIMIHGGPIVTTGVDRAMAVPGYAVVGVSEGGSRATPRERVVYSFADPAAARRRVERAWRRVATTSHHPANLFRVVSVRATERTVIVDLAPATPGAAMRMMSAGQPPFAVDPAAMP